MYPKIQLYFQTCTLTKYLGVGATIFLQVRHTMSVTTLVYKSILNKKHKVKIATTSSKLICCNTFVGYNFTIKLFICGHINKSLSGVIIIKSYHWH